MATSRKSLYLQAIQSERIQALIGPDQERFQVPKDLLVKCSPVFNKMCNSAFKESQDGVIMLPEVEAATFENFMLWLYSFHPSQSIQKEFPEVLDLAIFSNIYQILPLQNQTSDIILQLLNDSQFVTPEHMSRVYESTADGSVLRRHFCLAFCTVHAPTTQYEYTGTESESSAEWEAIFNAFPNFGRDYFRYTRKLPVLTVHTSDFCTFHDHSNMSDWEFQKKGWACPYKEGDWYENEVITQEEWQHERLRQGGNSKKNKRKTKLNKRRLHSAAAENPVEVMASHASAAESPPEEVLPEEPLPEELLPEEALSG